MRFRRWSRGGSWTNVKFTVTPGCQAAPATAESCKWKSDAAAEFILPSEPLWLNPNATPSRWITSTFHPLRPSCAAMPVEAPPPPPARPSCLSTAELNLWLTINQKQPKQWRRGQRSVTAEKNSPDSSPGQQSRPPSPGVYLPPCTFPPQKLINL